MASVEKILRLLFVFKLPKNPKLKFGARIKPVQTPTREKRPSNPSVKKQIQRKHREPALVETLSSQIAIVPLASLFEQGWSRFIK